MPRRDDCTVERRRPVSQPYLAPRQITPGKVAPVYNVRLVSRRLAGLFFAALIAAFPARLVAAAVAVEDVPVPGGSEALARALGIEPAPDRGRFLYEITRLIYDNPEGRRPEAARVLQSLRQTPGRRKRA